MRTFGIIVAAFISAPNAFADLDCSAFKMREQTPPAVNADASSFLWRIQKGQTPPSYILGTFHLSSPNAQDDWAAIAVLLSQLKTFIAETSLTDASARERAALSLGNDGETAGLLGADFKTQFDSLLAPYGMPFVVSNKLKPWAAFLQLAQPPGLRLSLDGFVATLAKAQGLNLVELQNPQEMIGSMEAISKADQTQILKETICNYEPVQNQTRQLMKLYSEGKVAEFLNESERLDSPTPGMRDKLEKALVEDRNAVFVPRIVPHLEQGSTLIAVGASHLFGDKGLLQSMRQKGYQVSPVDRAQAMAQWTSEANSKAANVVPALVTWLSTNGLQTPAGYTAPALKFVTRGEVKAKCGDDDCEAAIENGAVLVPVDQFHSALTGSPHLLEKILAPLIWDIQSRAASNDGSCVYFNSQAVQGVILRSRYLMGRGVGVAGLAPIPARGCRI